MICGVVDEEDVDVIRLVVLCRQHRRAAHRGLTTRVLAPRPYLLGTRECDGCRGGRILRRRTDGER